MGKRARYFALVRGRAVGSGRAFFAVATAASVFFCATPAPAFAGTVSITVSDSDGHPLPSAVVTLSAADNVPIPVKPAPRLLTNYIDQKDETFIPYVVAIVTGGTITFRNSDTTRHHVYTFSPIHPFDFILKPGDISPPQQFNQPGIAAIGCNIHDQMIAYVYISATPLTAVADTGGLATIADVPPGNYKLQAWYPQLKTGAAVSPQSVVVSTDETKLSISIPAIPHIDEAMDGMDGMN